MDLHEDLVKFRLAQRVLQLDEVTDRVLDVVNQGPRRVDDLLEAHNASQRGMLRPTELRTQFFLGDRRVMSKSIPLEFDNRDSVLMQSSSGDILDMYEWHKGDGNTDLHSYIVAHNDFARQYAQQFQNAPLVPPYAEELDVNPNGGPTRSELASRPLPLPPPPQGALLPADDDGGAAGGRPAAAGDPDPQFGEGHAARVQEEREEEQADAFAGAAPNNWGLGGVARFLARVVGARGARGRVVEQGNQANQGVRLAAGLDQQAPPGNAPQNGYQAAPEDEDPAAAAARQAARDPRLVRVQQMVAEIQASGRVVPPQLLQQVARLQGQAGPPPAAGPPAGGRNMQRIADVRRMIAAIQDRGLVVPPDLLARAAALEDEAEAAPFAGQYGNAFDGRAQDQEGMAPEVAPLRGAPQNPAARGVDARDAANRAAALNGIPAMYHNVYYRWLRAAAGGWIRQFDVLRQAFGGAGGMGGRGKPDSRDGVPAAASEDEIERLDSLFRQFKERSEVQVAARGVQLGGGGKVDDRPGDGTNNIPPTLPPPPPAIGADFTEPEKLQGGGPAQPAMVERGLKRSRAPHQIAGSDAAREHMARLRAKRGKKAEG